MQFKFQGLIFSGIGLKTVAITCLNYRHAKLVQIITNLKLTAKRLSFNPILHVDKA